MSYWDLMFVEDVESQVEKLLGEEGTTLDDLLDQDEIIQESVDGNEKLLEFLGQPENLKRLFQLVREPNTDEDASEAVKYKYPYVACQILISPQTALWEMAWEEESFLADHFFSWLDAEGDEAEVDTVDSMTGLLGNYFTTVFLRLVDDYTEKVMRFVHESKDILPRMVSRLAVFPLCDMFLKLFVRCREREGLRYDVEGWFVDNSFVKILLEKFASTSNPEARIHIADVMMDCIATFSYNPQESHVPLPAASSPVLAPLFESEIFVPFVESFLSDPEHVNHGEPIISSILGMHHLPLGVNRASEETQGEDHDDPEACPVVVATALGYIPRIITYLRLSDDSSADDDADDKKVVGFHRIRLIELLLSLLQTRVAKVSNILAESGMLETMLALFFEFPLNNIMHNAVLDIVRFVIEDNLCEPLQRALITKCTVHRSIIREFDGRASQTPPGKAFYGHILIMANLIDASPNNGFLKSLMTDDDDQTKWMEFAEAELSLLNEEVRSGGVPDPRHVVGGDMMGEMMEQDVASTMSEVLEDSTNVHGAAIDFDDDDYDDIIVHSDDSDDDDDDSDDDDEDHTFFDKEVLETADDRLREFEVENKEEPIIEMLASVSLAVDTVADTVTTPRPPPDANALDQKTASAFSALESFDPRDDYSQRTTELKKEMEEEKEEEKKEEEKEEEKKQEAAAAADDDDDFDFDPRA